MTATQHPRQTQRLRALRSLNILDTPRESDFDEVVELASEICGTAVSVINLIDLDRQWFKAEVGLGIRETPLETSLCAHAILEEDYLEIQDTRQDPRTRGNPLCTRENGFRFYAGALLVADDGLPIGTLCVLDTTPRELTDLQRKALKVLARQVMGQIELRQALRNSEAMRNEADHRVKNSLQSVASLIALQGRDAKDDMVRQALDQTHRQILTVASLHELLYRDPDAKGLDVVAYIERLADMLAQSVPPSISIRADADPGIVSATQAAAIGTLLNEFASNSLKHAFPDGQAGSIAFRLKYLADGAFLLVCEDDGIGFDLSNADTKASLGVRIMRASAEQMGGILIVRANTGGTGVEVTFKLLSSDD